MEANGLLILDSPVLWPQPTARLTYVSHWQPDCRNPEHAGLNSGDSFQFRAQ